MIDLFYSRMEDLFKEIELVEFLTRIFFFLSFFDLYSYEFVWIGIVPWEDV